jgi:hypothetical protein
VVCITCRAGDWQIAVNNFDYARNPGEQIADFVSKPGRKFKWK